MRRYTILLIPLMLTLLWGQRPTEGDGGGGDGGPEESETDSSGDTAFVNYQPTVSGGYYDYGKQGPYDGRLIIPTEEILSNRKYFA